MKSDIDLASYLDVSNGRALLDLILHWGGIVLLFALAHALNHPLAYLVAVVVMAGFQNGLISLMHEAVHAKCFRPRWLNQRIGRWVYGYPVGLPFHHDTVRHLLHHRLVGAREDPDWPNYQGDQYATAGSTLRFLSGKLVGTNLFANLLSFATRGRPRIAVSQADDGWAPSGLSELAGIFAVQLTLFSAVALLGRWWEYLLLWILPLATVTSFLIGVRAFIEHTHLREPVEPEARLSDFAAGPLGRFFISPCNFHLHALHHAYPAVPHYRLRALKAALCRRDGLGYAGSQKPGYGRALAEHLRVMARSGK